MIHSIHSGTFVIRLTVRWSTIYVKIPDKIKTNSKDNHMYKVTIYRTEREWENW